MERDRFFRFLFYVYFFISLSFLILKIDPLIDSTRVLFAYLFDPSFSVGTINKFQKIRSNIRSILETEIINKKLIEEKKEIETKLLNLTKLESENSRLIELLDVKRLFKYTGRYARIISINPRKPYSFVYIDKGYSDGISLYNPVVSYVNKEWVLVGRVMEVYDDYSKVILITNSNFSFIADTAESRGLLNGEFSDNLYYKYIDGKIKLGDEVYTSKASITFPPFIKIGNISNIISNSDLSLVTANVSVYKIRDLDWVYVVDFKPYKEFEAKI